LEREKERFDRKEEQVRSGEEEEDDEDEKVSSMECSVDVDVLSYIF